MTFTTLALLVCAFVAVIAVATIARRTRGKATHVGPHSTHTDTGAGYWSPGVYSGNPGGDSGSNDCSSDAGGGQSGGGDCGGSDGGGGGSD